jgi:hypothetical protein
MQESKPQRALRTQRKKEKHEGFAVKNERYRFAASQPLLSQKPLFR